MSSELLVVCPNCKFYNDPLEAWSGEDSSFYEAFRCIACSHLFMEDECERRRRDGKMEIEFNCPQFGGTIGWKKLTEKQIMSMDLGDRIMFEGIGYMFTIRSFAVNFPHPEGRIDLDLLMNPPPKPKFLITLERKR